MPPVFTKEDKFVAFLCIFVVLLIFFVWYNTYKYMTLNTYLFVKLSIKKQEEMPHGAMDSRGKRL